jgi:hypothetical protein
MLTYADVCIDAIIQVFPPKKILMRIQQKSVELGDEATGEEVYVC